MRGLFRAGLLLVPALTSAFAVPELGDFWADGKQREQVEDHKHDGAISRTINLAEAGSHDIPGPILTFQVDVLPSTQVCGVGNVLVNGQELQQGSRGDGSSGKGNITDHQKVISASWDFDCLRGVTDEPSAQFMKFTIEAVDGKPVEDLAFTMMFRQSPTAEIVMTSPDLALDAPTKKMPSFPNISDEDVYEQPFDVENYDFEREIEDLEDMIALVQELKYRIREKKQEISAMYAAQELDVSISSCDSLKCVIQAGLASARKIVHKVTNDVLQSMDGNHRPPHHKGPPHWKKPHFPGKPGNHSHGNHTCHPPHGNHTHPPPHWRKPHFRLPPKFCHKFCHPRPPPPHHPPPHRGPPHHGPPHDAPPHHGPPPFDFPPHHGPPKDHDGPPHGPPEDHHREDGPHDGPPPPPNEPPQDGPPEDKEDRHHGSGNEPLGTFDGPPHGPPFEPPHKRPHPPHHRGGPPPLILALHALKFIVAAVLFGFLFVTMRRCCCSSSRRTSRAARKEERNRRRAYRRAAQKQAWKAWIVSRFRLTSADDEDLEYEEKYGSFAPIDGESDIDDDVASEIQQLQSAASVVSDMVAAEEGRAGRVSMESRTTSLPGYEGEDLPVYEESDGSEESSLVADGFRYTPGSSDYTPGHSPNISNAGSVRAVLGDTKE